MVARLAMGIFEFEDPSRAAKVALNAAGEVVRTDCGYGAGIAPQMAGAQSGPNP